MSLVGPPPPATTNPMRRLWLDVGHELEPGWPLRIRQTPTIGARGGMPVCMHRVRAAVGV